MLRSSLLTASFAFVSFVTACGGVQVPDSDGNTVGAGGSTTTTTTTTGEGGGGAAFPCEPTTVNATADFVVAHYDVGEDIAVTCTITKAEATARYLECPDADGDPKQAWIQVPEAWALQAVPTTGTLFLRSAQVPHFAWITEMWFELRADPNSPILLAGINALTTLPPNAAASDWFQPFGVELRDTNCGDEPYWACERKRQLDLIIHQGAGADDVVLRSAQTADIGPLGELHVTVGAAERHIVRDDPDPDCSWGEQMSGVDDVRVLIAAKPQVGGK